VTTEEGTTYVQTITSLIFDVDQYQQVEAGPSSECIGITAMKH
jgi:hypothetical protein